MSARNAAHKVEKREVGPGQYVITDSRYQLPKEGKKEAEAAWIRRIETAGKIIRASRVNGSMIDVTDRRSK